MLQLSILPVSQHHYGVICGSLSTPKLRVPLPDNGRQLRGVLGERIRENIQRMREGRNWSRPQLGMRCVPPTSGQQIERLEKGQRGLDVDWIERIARGFGVEPAELIVGDVGQFAMDEQVAAGIAESFARIVLRGGEPDPDIVADLALIVRELSETFSRHPEARSDPRVARPVVDLLMQRRGRPQP